MIQSRLTPHNDAIDILWDLISTIPDERATVVPVRLPDAMAAQLERFAREHDVQPGEIIAALVGRFCEALE